MQSPLGDLTFCSARDITARKAVEQTLVRTQALLQALGQAVPSACLVVRHQNDSIQYVNHRFCVLWNVLHLEAALDAGKLSYSQLLLAMQPALADPQAFFATRMQLEDETQSATLQDQVRLLEQRVLRRYSAPVNDAAGNYVGRLYLFDEEARVLAP